MAIPKHAPGISAGIVKTELRLRGPLVDFLFKPAQRNRVYKSAMIFGAGYWIGEFLPKRFSNYAERLGYKATAKWEIRKQRKLGFITPYVGLSSTGEQRLKFRPMMQTALSGARVQATSSTTKGQKLAVIVPYGHPLRQFHHMIFRRVPYWEYERVAEKAAQALDYMIQNPTTVKGYSPGKTTAQRRSMGTRKRKAA
jgi:hypothetical protein